MEDLPSATVSSNNLEEWAQEHRGDCGVVYKRKPSVQLKIEGCYVPNSSGCAQTEGVYKIPLSEKRKYLPQYKVRFNKLSNERFTTRPLSYSWLGAVLVSKNRRK